MSDVVINRQSFTYKNTCTRKRAAYHCAHDQEKSYKVDSFGASTLLREKRSMTIIDLRRW